MAHAAGSVGPDNPDPRHWEAHRDIYKLFGVTEWHNPIGGLHQYQTMLLREGGKILRRIKL